MLSLIDRFMSHIAPEPNTGCWLWTASVRAGSGYGQLRDEHMKNQFAHRIAYRLFVGPIPDGSLICHTCDVPLCQNPDHLFAGTPKDNAQDALRKGRMAHCGQTHCRHGHARTPENTVTYQRRRSTVTVCRICQRISVRKSMEKCRERLKHAA